MEGYSEVLTFLLNRYGPLMTVKQVSEATGYCVRLVTNKTYGWEGNRSGLRMKTAVLARQLCRR